MDHEVLVSGLLLHSHGVGQVAEVRKFEEEKERKRTNSDNHMEKNVQKHIERERLNCSINTNKIISDLGQKNFILGTHF